MDVDSRVGIAGDATTYRIHHTEDQSALRTGQLDGRQRVRRLTTLADGQDYVVMLDDRLAVPELAGVGHLDRDTAEMLDQLLADQARMP